ncbi:YczE/YyaS/YitT family protein [Halalkalibacter alkaliphilus]|uniref:Integral membrane protein n=1 Tax=Halalkalibacter alkaliphilus TaxID=2917993 RepID=A0A9X1ZYX7_9BACI|nr:hypothetical protein [Halalkalibacter alkaliphilus]MCL7746197.1 hypothetical protein [Halalkalibacter alkaliphilus]
MLRRIMFFFIGQFILTLGCSLIIKASLGASPWEALAIGQSQLWNLTIGTCAVINGVFVILINSLILKKKPEILSVLTIFLTGSLIDFWLLIGLKNFDPQNLIVQIMVVLTGIMILGMGVSTYLQAKFPANPMDRLMEVIHERFGFSLRIAKLIAESFALTLAFFFDGAMGMATLLVAFTTGYFIQFFYPKFEFLFNNTRQVLFKSEFTLFFVKLRPKKSTPLKT